MSKKYDEQREKEEEIEKQLALAEVKRWFEKTPDENRDKPAVVVATKVFTPREVVKEVEMWTEDGRRFAKMLNEVRIELAKREE
jgi:hypothetical protein